MSLNVADAVQRDDKVVVRSSPIEQTSTCPRATSPRRCIGPCGDDRTRAVALLQKPLPQRELNSRFTRIVSQGTGRSFKLSDNDDWEKPYASTSRGFRTREVHDRKCRFCGNGQEQNRGERIRTADLLVLKQISTHVEVCRKRVEFCCCVLKRLACRWHSLFKRVEGLCFHSYKIVYSFLSR
jgi:hypothetical protein